MEHILKITSIENATHDVLRIQLEKPNDLDYTPGQAADVSINQQEWKDEKRPFTFTSIPSFNHLEFTIKTYLSHKGVTAQLLNLAVGDELIIHDVFGDIHYKGEGVFIAGGAGTTPFVSMFRQLYEQNIIVNNKLIFANKTHADIINYDEFKSLLGDNFINILSDEKAEGYEHGFITEDFLRSYIADVTKPVYLCGPPPMMEAVMKALTKLGVKDEMIIRDAW